MAFIKSLCIPRPFFISYKTIRNLFLRVGYDFGPLQELKHGVHKHRAALPDLFLDLLRRVVQRHRVDVVQPVHALHGGVAERLRGLGALKDGGLLRGDQDDLGII